MVHRRQIDRSFRKFDDLASDIQNADFRTWGECLKHLLTHCEEDAVMKHVTGSLRSHPNVDLKGWYKQFVSTGGGMVGTGRYTLPIDDEERTALLYQFLIEILEGKIDFTNFCMHAYGTSKFQDSVYKMNTEIVGKFTREVSYRLNEVETDLGDNSEVESSALMVFNYHGPVQHISGGVYGGIVAANSTVTDNKINYNDHVQLAQAVKNLSDDLNGVLEDHRDSVSEAFALLVRAIETNTTPKPSKLATAIESIDEASPDLSNRLRGIVDNAAGSLVATAIAAIYSRDARLKLIG